jgi:serine/tyrosine/threonine adenylyltransferase
MSLMQTGKQNNAPTVNPCYVPRQHLLQYAIDAATQKDYSELHTLLQVLRNPYTEQPGMEKYAQPPPAEMVKPGICQLSCSS